MSNQTSIPLRQKITGYWLSQAIYVAAKLGIADLLTSGPKSVAELAEATGADTGLLFRLMRALASEGIFAQLQEQQFALTPMAELLTSKHPQSLRYYAIFYGEEAYHAFGHLLDSVKTGKPAFDKVFGKSFFDYLQSNQQASQTFNQAMSSVSNKQIEVLVAEYGFSNINTLVDVGGGRGHLLAGILRANPNMQGVLYDLPHVIDEAVQFMKSENLLDRCKFIAGDFFQEVPTGGDAYLMKYILHDWDDARALAILKNCRKAMSADAKLLVVDQIIPEGNEPFFAKLADIFLFTLQGGKERSKAEFCALFKQADFELTDVLQTSYLLSVIEGKPC